VSTSTWVEVGLGTCAGLELAAIVVLLVLYVRARGRVRWLESLDAERRSAPRTVTGRAIKTVVDTAMRVREQGVGGLLVSSLEELTRWTAQDRAEIARVAAPDGTVTIFFSDIEGSTALNEELGDAAFMRVLESHNAVVRRHVEKLRGHVVKTQGDGFMIVFGLPVDAVRAALRIQAAFDEPPRRLRATVIKVRIGVHVGPVVSREGDYFGRNVAFAARVAAEARGGQILISDDLRLALGEQAEFVVKAAGEVELKGLADRHLLWSVVAAPA
jgi:class 3 adenylate cyclase